MSLWTLSPAELVAELSRPAPIRQPCVAVVAVPTPEQIKAARAVLRAARPTRMTFRGWEDFQPALSFACELAQQAYGRQWYLNPEACLKARVPTAWVSCPLDLRSSVSSRDINVPVARFWRGARLPVGLEYAPIGPLAAGNVVPLRPRLTGPVLELLPCEWGEAAD
jgi:hypothetical protein